MALPVNKGQKVSEHYDILGNLIKTGITNDDGVIAGETYLVAPFIVVCGYTTAKSATDTAEFPGWNQGHFVVRKKAGTAWTKGDPLTAEAVASHEYLAWDVATAGQAIHGYAFKDAASGDVEGQILGPLVPPYNVVGTMADILAALSGSVQGQILVADGTGGIELTSFAIPVIDGSANQILKTDGSEVVSWAADAT